MKDKKDMEQLGFLIGKWKTEGEIKATGGNPAGTISGTDSYEWILGGHFIQHKADVVMNNRKVEVLEIIGEFDPKSKKFKMRSFENEGTYSVMEANLDEKGLFHITGDKIRSRLSVVDKHCLTAQWENMGDNWKWTPWMVLKFTRM